MFYDYVLQSETIKHFYTGFAADPAQRVGQHNVGLTKSTKNRGPRKLVYQEDFATRAEVMRREKFLQSGQGTEQLKELPAKGRP